MTNETPYSQARPPKTITRIKSDRFLDLTNLHTWILFAALAACMYLFREISNSIIVVLTATKTMIPEEMITHAYMDILLYAVLLVLVIYTWFKYFRSDDLVEYQKTGLYFSSRIYAGST